MTAAIVSSSDGNLTAFCKEKLESDDRLLLWHERKTILCLYLSLRKLLAWHSKLNSNFKSHRSQLKYGYRLREDDTLSPLTMTLWNVLHWYYEWKTHVEVWERVFQNVI